MIETSEIRISPAQYVRIAMGSWLASRWWLVALPVAICAVMSLVNRLWLVALLALILVMYPAIMAVVYINHALRPEAAFGTIPHTLTVGDDGALTVTYHPGEDVRCPESRSFATDDIASVEDHGKMLIITLKSSKYDFLVVPVDKIPEGKVSHFRDFKLK